MLASFAASWGAPSSLPGGRIGLVFALVLGRGFGRLRAPGIVAQQREGFPTDVQKVEHD